MNARASAILPHCICGGHGVDLPQASIGPGMAIYSRYSRVSESGGTPLTVSDALDEINKALN